MSDSLLLNKVMASVLVGGIVFMVSGMVANGLVAPKKLDKTAIKIDVPKTAEPAAEGAPAALAPIAALLVKADPAAGAADMQKLCSVCHNWEKGGPAKVGPNLYGIVGAPHAHMAGFTYSDGLKAIKGPWTYDELNVWLHNPRDVVPGTRMSFAGIDSDKERADVIDYLHTLSDSPEPLPPAGAGGDATKAASAAAPVAPAAGSGQTQTQGALSPANALPPQAGAPPHP